MRVEGALGTLKSFCNVRSGSGWQAEIVKATVSFTLEVPVDAAAGDNCCTITRIFSSRAAAGECMAGYRVGDCLDDATGSSSGRGGMGTGEASSCILQSLKDIHTRATYISYLYGAITATTHYS
mmetsp:Transcript_42231/g.67871  ORF Transcript_42231/g.67871 Transcript_42231/m.67871 type:complete len:124 (-) Transcript_42231:252-623(-)